MNVGDPKKAIVLAIIAVMVVSVAVFRVMPGGDTRPPSPSALINRDRSAPAQTEKSPSVQPDQLTVDSFSHPNLSKETVKPTPPPLRERAARTRKDEGQPPFRPDTSSIAPNDAGGSEGNAQLPDTKPEENTGIGQQQKGEAPNGVAVRLEAIVRSGESMALLSVAHGKAIACHEGSIVNAHIKVIKIKESSIVVQASGKQFEIAVGDEVNL